ncbi:MAG: hypothetical protein HZC02_00940 [Candidatus Levybacteria bacterium]|nr:hypothetical protein [Candidatus Levybacteria bacterium]
MPVEYTLQTQQTQVPVQEHTLPTRYLVLVGIVIAITTLLLGILLGAIFSKPKNAPKITKSAQPSPTISQKVVETVTPTPMQETISLAFLPGKQYFDDAYIAVEEKSPHKTLLLSVARLEQQQNFTQFTKVSYFDGKEWKRITLTNTTQDGTVVPNSLLRLWNDIENAQGDLKKIIATVQVQKQIVSLASPTLSGEISIQSLPGSTKFIYQGVGTLQIDNQSFDVKVFRSKTYSFNASDLSFLGTPELLTSDFMISWDQEGAFYYGSSHKTQNSINKIQNSQLGVLEDAIRKVSKSLQISSSMSQSSDSQKQYQITLQDPINTRISYPMINTVEKSPSQAYSWILGVGDSQIVKSEGRTVDGYGVFEFIQQLK